MSNTEPALSMRIHPIRSLVRLEGYSRNLTHPRHGRGAHFHADIPQYLIIKDLTDFVERGATGFGSLDLSDINGRLIWDSGDISELTWVRITQFESAPVSVYLQSCDPWPPAGSPEEFHEPFEVAPDVPELVVGAFDHWQAGTGPLDEIGMRVMARVTADDPAATSEMLQFMAAQRGDRWVDQTLPDAFVLSHDAWDDVTDCRGYC